MLPIATLVALTSMVIGAIARIFDQRETLIALNLAGTPQSILLAAQRRELILPTAVLGGIAAIGGLASGLALGAASLLNPYSLVGPDEDCRRNPSTRARRVEAWRQSGQRSPGDVAARGSGH